MKPTQKCFNAYAFHKCILILPEKHPLMPEIEDVFQKKVIMKKRVWSRETKNSNQHYIETGILGSYETAGIVDSMFEGTAVPMFEDTELKEQSDSICLERRMIVGGKMFAIRSVFPKKADSTPTDKILSLIDKEQAAEQKSL